MPTCFPKFTGVPYSGAAGLDWWSGFTTGSTVPRYFPDDPDWLNCLAITHGDGTTEHVSFRALCNSDYLFLSWVVRVAPPVPAPTPILMEPWKRSGLDFLIGDGTDFVAVKMRLQDTSAKDSSQTFIRDVHTYSGGVLSTDPLDPDPPWMTDTSRIWQDYDTPRSTVVMRWAIQIAIPFGVDLNGAGLRIAADTNFKFWYNVRLYSAGGIHVFPFPGTVTNSTSNTAIIPVTTPAFTGFDALANFSDVAGSGCDTSPGVRVSGAQIGIKDPGTTPAGTDRAPTARNSIQVDLGSGPPYNTGVDPDTAQAQHQNRFFVAPDITGIGAGRDPASIRAKFSIAPWGSQEGVTIPGSTWEAIPGGSAVAYDTGTNDAHFIFPTNDTPTVDPAGWNWLRNFVRDVKLWYNSPPNNRQGRHPHRCILVELSSTNNDIIFAVSSAYANFNFVNASTFTRLAEISVAGLQPINSQPRDVYLYLQTLNMPKVVEKKLSPTTGGIMRDGRYVRDDNNPIDTYEELVEFLPTYQVHAYHDTGLKMSYEDGSQVPILEAQTSFGYFAIHEGNVVGWEARLYGAEKIAENFYRVRVPNNGSVYVETAVQARETADEVPLRPESSGDTCRMVIEQLLRRLGLFGQIILKVLGWA